MSRKIGVQKLPFNSQFENTKISLNNYKCSLHLKRTDNSCIMPRDIHFYLAISCNFQLWLKSVLLACRRALKNVLLACGYAFKSAFLACCHTLKVPLFWKLYHALFWGWGETLLPYWNSCKYLSNFLNVAAQGVTL